MTDRIMPPQAPPLDGPEGLGTAPQMEPERDSNSNVVGGFDDVDLDGPSDPNLVDFTGSDDPENPMNWTTSKKMTSIAIISVMTFLSPVCSTITAPAVNQIMKDFESDNSNLAALVTTIFILGYFLGPILIAPLSEIYGRSPLYRICIVLFVAANVACALAPSLDVLIVFRLFGGIMGSCPITLGAGTVADMIPADRRAGTMAAYVVGGVLGPSIGPICAGYLTPAMGWRWNFWLMTILSAPVAIVAVLVLRESYPYILLQRKTARLRLETGNAELRSVMDSGLSPKDLFFRSITRPLRMLLSRIVFGLSLYVALVYGYFYLCFTTFPQVFGHQYGFDSREVGLVTIGLAIGSLIGVCLCAAVIDRLSARLTDRHGGDPQPEYRLPVMALGGLFVPVGLFWYGWSAEYKLHWIMPVIGSSFIGAGMMTTYMASSMYLVDAYPIYAASATAAATILRCLIGGLLPALAGDSLHESLGVGWGSSVLGLVAVVFIPVPTYFYKCGSRIRESKRSKTGF